MLNSLAIRKIKWILPAALLAAGIFVLGVGHSQAALKMNTGGSKPAAPAAAPAPAPAPEAAAPAPAPAPKAEAPAPAPAPKAEAPAPAPAAAEAKEEAAPAPKEEAPKAEAPKAAAPAPAPASEEAAPALTPEELAAEEAAEAPKATGSLIIESKPEGVKVFVDGDELGVTPIAVDGLSDSPHEIILFHPEKGAFSQLIERGSGKVFIDLTSQGGLGVGFVTVETTPSNVRVDLDGKRLGLSPINQPVVAGKHKILLSKEGYTDREVSIDVSAGGKVTVKETMEEKAGALLVIVNPSGAEVFFDGASLGVANAPMRIADVPAGMHEIRIQKDGFSPWERKNIKVTREKTETILASLQAVRSETNVRIYTEPEGARVWLDGKELGVAGPDGLGFLTDKGTHVLKMELNPAVTPGYRPLQVSVSFNEDNVDYKQNPIKLPIIDEAYLSAQKLFEAGKSEEAISFLDRVDPTKVSYPESRIMMIQVLENLKRINEIPAEFEKLFAIPMYRQNPVLNLSMGYWTIIAAKQAGKEEGSDYLGKGIEALDRCVESIDYFPADERQALALKAHYYTGIASELLFGLTGEKKYVKKGVQAWEMFFARLAVSEETLGTSWVDKAKKHQKNLSYLEKKLGR